jgi:hypothetical protein
VLVHADLVFITGSHASNSLIEICQTRYGKPKGWNCDYLSIFTCISVIRSLSGRGLFHATSFPLRVTLGKFPELMSFLTVSGPILFFRPVAERNSWRACLLD